MRPLSPCERALLEFACCTYYLRYMPASASPLASKQVSPEGAEGAGEAVGSKDALTPPDAMMPGAPRGESSEAAQASNGEGHSVLSDTLMEMAGTLLYADSSAILVREHLIASLAHLAFTTTPNSVVPTKDCETIVDFWCNCVAMGLDGHYDDGDAWGRHWLWLMRCTDLLLANIAPMCPTSDRWHRCIIHALDTISAACLKTRNKAIGKAVFDWVMELAQAVNVK
ncbi:hypothetical protein ACHHYP_05778 [Achlya hypogyna]|uniref:Uncharacterized protein n=1 Tax=Achlya hypogyna TaxID=1202772 RepID=A0A1V9YWN2_ACHHY|nr:hypothetical protein ACHHYP_05778 [Achlya hypogyna]